jgi:hypothetical protein
MITYSSLHLFCENSSDTYYPVLSFSLILAVVAVKELFILFEIWPSLIGFETKVVKYGKAVVK